MKSNCLTRMISILILTIVGSLLLIPVEIIDNLSKLFKFFGLIFGGPKGVEKVGAFFTSLKQKLTGLNAF